MQFFARASHREAQHAARSPAPLPPPGAAPRQRASVTLDLQLRGWLETKGYRYTTECSVGGAVAIVEDASADERLCVCLDGGIGTTLTEWRDERRAQTALERAGWRFHRIWRMPPF
jgi:very-short-patch-repair endonuclease